MKHINIPIFIPHLGCPNDCVFCNQRSISGKRVFDEGNVVKEIEAAIATKGDDREAEIAFFGGSFTGIDRGLMVRLLDTAQKYIDDGKVNSIRLSTRPDYINDEILMVLSRYRVTDIELGIQSMSDEVLAASRRGHTVDDTVKACRLVKEYGFNLVGQMMTGLPRSTPELEVMTAEEICKLDADGARIYPTMVFGKTRLEEMMNSGEYTPPSLEDAVSRTAGAYRVFLKNGVTVLRIGLHSGESLYSEDGITGGSYHPAMGELVAGEVYKQLIEDELNGKNLYKAEVTVSVAEGYLSKAIGQNGRNREYFIKKYSLRKLKIQEEKRIKPFSCEVMIENDKE